MVSGKLANYTDYRDSGVSWLGAVPTHWPVVRLKNAVSKIVGGSTPSSTESAYWDGDIVWVTPVDVGRGNRLLQSSRTITREGLRACSAELVPAGSIIVTCRAPVGNAALAGVSLCTNQGCKALIPDRTKIMPEFGLSLIRVLQQELQSLATGTTFTEISTSKLSIVPIPLPPIGEQRAIVKFLHYMDTRIRRYIHAKQKTIALLNEHKQVIIQRAVTRGLNPHARFKSSGLKSLRDVPTHWEIRKLQQITDHGRPIMYGIVLPGPDVDTGVYIVKGRNCEPGQLRPGCLSRTTYEIEATHARSRLRRNDVVFAIRGGVGATEMVPAELEGANLTQDAARIAPGKGIDPRWLLYALRAPAIQEQVHARVVGATVRGINIRDLKRVDVPVPPPDEQLAIAAFLDESSAAIDTLVGRVNTEIRLVREFHINLITDVVTGKLDVREVATQLPEDDEDLDLTEDPGGSDDVDHDVVPEEANA